MGETLGRVGVPDVSVEVIGKVVASSLACAVCTGACSTEPSAGKTGEGGRAEDVGGRRR